MTHAETLSDIIRLFTICEELPEYPDKIVVRLWVITADNKLLPTNNVKLYETIAAARKPLRKSGLKRFPHMPGDDEAVVETWVSEYRAEA